MENGIQGRPLNDRVLMWSLRKTLIILSEEVKTIWDLNEVYLEESRISFKEMNIDLMA
jgi:hypothetical protein